MQAELVGVVPITVTPFDDRGRVELRKEVLRRRGAIRTVAVRAPGPALDELTRAELAATLDRLGLADRLAGRDAGRRAPALSPPARRPGGRGTGAGRRPRGRRPRRSS